MFSDLIQNPGKELVDVVKNPSEHIGEILCLGALAGGVAVAGKLAFNAARLASEERAAQLVIDGLPDLMTTRIASNFTADAVEMRMSIDAGGVKRALTVHVPPGFDASAENRVLVGFDSTQMGRPAGALNKINGLGEASDTHGFLGVFPEHAPRGRIGLLNSFSKSLTSWNAEGLPMNYRPGLGNDVQLVRNIAEAVPKAVNVDPHRFVLTGFSDGAWLVNKAVATTERLPVSGVASISGSIAEADALPQSGLKALVVRGSKDMNFPAAGGAGPNTRMLKWLGHPNIETSAPSIVAERYATANGLLEQPVVNETDLYVERNFAATKPGQAPVREYEIKDGGHVWHGRKVGEGMESQFSKAGKNGRPLTADEFNLNELIVRYFDLGKTVHRDLL